MWIPEITATLLLGAALGGCGLFTDEEACTLRGCYSGLYIRFEERPPSNVAVGVRLPDGTLLERECLPEACEVFGTLFEAVAAPHVEISVTMDGKTETFTADLEYELFYPNGEDCGDPCLVTTVNLKQVGDRLVAA